MSSRGYLGVLGDACARIFLEGKPRSTVGRGLPGRSILGQGFYAQATLLACIHPTTQRNCPKRVGGACGVALRSTSTILFDPFWPPWASQIHAQSVVRTPFRTADSFKAKFACWGFSEVRIQKKWLPG